MYLTDRNGTGTDSANLGKDIATPEITPAMIEAGVSVLCRMELATASEKYWAKKIYAAMASRRLEGARPPDERTSACSEG